MFRTLEKYDVIHKPEVLSASQRAIAYKFAKDREISFLFQRLSVLIQRYNAILLADCFVKEEEE